MCAPGIDAVTDPETVFGTRVDKGRDERLRTLSDCAGWRAGVWSARVGVGRGIRVGVLARLAQPAVHRAIRKIAQMVLDIGALYFRANDAVNTKRVDQARLIRRYRAIL